MKPNYVAGDRVYVLPLKMEATVIRQVKHYDGDDEFYGNVELIYDNGEKGISNGWQVKLLRKAQEK
jgi:hypothetical protein